MKLDFYYLEKKKRLNLSRVIHKNQCELLPTENGRISLGFFENALKARTNAEKQFNNLKLCKICCREV